RALAGIPGALLHPDLAVVLARRVDADVRSLFLALAEPLGRAQAPRRRGARRACRTVRVDALAGRVVSDRTRLDRRDMESVLGEAPDSRRVCSGRVLHRLFAANARVAGALRSSVYRAPGPVIHAVDGAAPDRRVVLGPARPF